MDRSNKILATLFLISLLLVATMLPGQDTAKVFKSFFDEALKSDIAYNNLRELCEKFPGRLTGSKKAAGAVAFSKHLMEQMGLDRVWLQEVWVKTWQPGQPAVATLHSEALGQKDLNVCAIGGSIGTGRKGISGPVVEVKDFAQLHELGRGGIAGKIVFYNHKMDPTLIQTFAAYGKAAGYRTRGAIEAAKLGGLAVVVRSLTTALDDFPHTGIMQSQKGVPAIPAISISTRGAEQLSAWLQSSPHLTMHMATFGRMLPDSKSHNVIGEIRGSHSPEKIISVGGHLDAWFNAPGAHDDGGGCMQAIEVLRLFKTLKIKPRHTLRAVMFMDEEVSQRGGQAYAAAARKKGELHIAAIESDRGVLIPRSLGITAPRDTFNTLLAYKKYFAPYGIDISRGGGGVDIGPLKTPYPDIILGTLIPDSQRYFDYHHSANDTFEQVNIREMQMGSAAMACLIYLIDNLE